MPSEAIPIRLEFEPLVAAYFHVHVQQLSRVSDDPNRRLLGLALSEAEWQHTPAGLVKEVSLSAETAAGLVRELEVWALDGAPGGDTSLEQQHCEPFRSQAKLVRQALSNAGWEVVDGPYSRIWVVDPVDKPALARIRASIQGWWRKEKAPREREEETQ